MAFNSFMHERNIYKNRPDFIKIATDYPEFRKYVDYDRKSKGRIDFTNTAALRALTKVLLKKDFNLSVEIPDGFLIPTIPQRLNYILWIEDLLTAIPQKNEIVSAIDIGTGPCAILSLIGTKKNNWQFVSTETTDEAINWAEKNILTNNLDSSIKVVKVSKDSILQEILTADEKSYDFCLCNPPFFENIDDIRKKSPKVKEKIEAFAKKEEIFSEGGETAFVKQMIKDSLQFRDRISLYTSMFGKKKSYIEILKELHTIQDVTYTKTEFCQGNTIRWGIAWTFLKSVDFLQFEKAKPKTKKAKPPLVYSILRKGKNGSTASVEQILERIKEIFSELEIFSKLIKSAENYAEIQITSNKNTWSHQRRKRREELKSKMQENKFNETFKNTEVKDSQISVSVTDKTDVKESIDNPNDSLSTTKSESSVHSKGENIYQSDDTQSVITSFNVLNDVGISDPSLSCPDNSELPSVSVEWKNNDESKICKEEINTEHKHSEDSVDKLSEDNASNKCKRKSDWETSPKKKMKLALIESDIKNDNESVSSSNKCKRKSDWETSPEKKIKLAPIESDIKNDNENVSSEGIPLLFSTIKLRKTKEHILLEMNCPPEYNRDSMHQIFQLFKNKFT